MTRLSTHSALESFLMDREAENLSPRSIGFYRQKISVFLRFLASQGVTDVEGISPRLVRAFLVSLKDDHTPGGVHAYYRSIKVFCRWLYAEEETATNVMQRIRAPKVPQEIQEPVSMGAIQTLLETCDSSQEIGARDVAIMVTLLDTGLRAAEFLFLDIGDVNLHSGRILVRHTKNGRQRVAFLGDGSLAALSHYLEFRALALDDPLFTSRYGTRLTYTGLRDILRRRSKVAGIPAPTLHDFRRSFALYSLRGGMDIFNLQKLMGHTDLSILRRYLAQNEEDLRTAHEKAGPVDHHLFRKSAAVGVVV